MYINVYKLIIYIFNYKKYISLIYSSIVYIKLSRNIKFYANSSTLTNIAQPPGNCDDLPWVKWPKL